jgi:hypothetical protein
VLKTNCRHILKYNFKSIALKEQKRKIIMKKLIVAAIILIASMCQAGVKEDIFKYIDIIDITKIGGNDSETSFGISIVDVTELKILFNKFIESNYNYVVVHPWNIYNGKECVCFINIKSGKVYLLMVDGRLVAFETL